MRESGGLRDTVERELRISTRGRSVAGDRVLQRIEVIRVGGLETWKRKIIRNVKPLIIVHECEVGSQKFAYGWALS